MTESTDKLPAAAVVGTEPSAGAMLRAAREKRGLHIAALAASIKVAPRKLESLEADRFGELPDLTFTRALAQTVCRALKIDAEPVLARMPQAGDMPRLLQVGGGLNAPFHQADAGRGPGRFGLLLRPAFWATLLVLLGALALALLPESWMPWRLAADSMTSPSARALPPVASASAWLPVAADALIASAPTPASAAAATGAAAVEMLHVEPASGLAGATGAATTAGILAVRAQTESWVEVQDAKGQTLLSRTVQPGETVGVDGALPLRVSIGNAAATQLMFRGAPIDLAAHTRDNVARLQLP